MTGIVSAVGDIGGLTGIERTAYDVAISFGLLSKPEASTNENFWLICEISANCIV